MPDFTHSIIIASRNEGDALRRTVEDVCRHAGAEALEIVVVDDASSDGSASVLQDTAARTPHAIRLERNEERRGLIFSRARGADLARGEYLVFLDAHCAVGEGWLDHLREELVSIGCRGIAVPLVYVLKEEGWTIDRTSLPASGCSIANCFLDFDWMPPQEMDGRLSTCTIGGMAWMCPQSWYAHIGGLDREMRSWGGENIDMALRTWIAGGWCIVAPPAEIGHRFRDESPEAIDNEELLYNKIRLAHTVFSRDTFHRVLANLGHQTEFLAAYARAKESLVTLAPLKGYIESIRRRSEPWLIDTFRLPILEAPFFYRPPRKPIWRSKARKFQTFVQRRRPRVAIVLTGETIEASLITSLLFTTTYKNCDVFLLSSDEVSLPEHPRLRVIRSSPALSSCEADSTAVAVGSADITVLLSGSARILDEFWLERVLLLFERRPHLALACPRICRHGEKDVFDEIWSWSEPPFSRLRRGGPLSESPYQSFSCFDGALFIRRQAFLDLGGFDDTLRERSDRVWDLSIRAWLCGYEVFCHPGIRFGWSENNSDGRAAEPLHPSPAAWRDYARLLPAVKYFTNARRVAACRKRSASTSGLLERFWPAIERARRSFFARVRFDDDWLFYKFGIEDYPDE